MTDPPIYSEATASRAAQDDFTGAGGPSALLESLSVAQVDPAAGSSLPQTPSTITVSFNLPIDPFSLNFDFALQQVNADGSVTPLDPSLLSEPDGFGPPSQSLALTVNAPLAPGHYQVVLLGASSIAGMTDSGDVLWSPPGGPGTDTVVDDFTIAVPGVTLADATSLGSVGSSPTVATGALDLLADPSSVALYQVTLDPGHYWQFGAELWASRIGSPLAATLSLFDSQGTLIRTASVGAPDSPRDPYFFAGLAPGTYYVGVSGAGNVPGAAGGYDPAAGTAGVGVPQNGGAFQLDIAAVPDDVPTEVRAFTLQRADPLSTTPTGFTLGFSGWMDLASFGSGSGQPFQALQVVDQSGTVWSVTPVAFDQATNQFTFLFDQRLPAGNYTLRLPAEGGVTDLAGRPPVAPGEPSGVLASFTVDPVALPPGPDDLGALTSQVHTGIDLSTNLAPGASVNFRMVVLVPDVYTLATSYTGGPLSIQLSGPNGLVSFDAGAAGQPQVNLMTLNPGVYELKFSATGSQAVGLRATFEEPFLSWEHQLDNGVGHGPALNLLFLAPLALSADDSAPGSGSSQGETTSSSGATVAVAGGTGTSTITGAPSLFAPTAPVAPGGLILTLGGTLAGIPGNTSSQTANASSSAATSPGPLAPQEHTGERVGNPPSSSLSYDATADVSDPEALTRTTDGALAAALKPLEFESDGKIVANNEWLGRVGERLTYWFALAPETVRETVGATGDLRELSPERISLQRDGLPPVSSDRVEKADLSLPLGLGVISVIAVRLRDPVRRWWRGRVKRSEAHTLTHKGPHRKF
ncbi:MAG: hypothetical protein P4L84_11990 [Isosphaeraceae bacterium]|nr:hypothetical protein [Isosphaeraceae bacterium]